MGLEGRWVDLDARHNYPRLGRILMATGRDAADVAITTSFGAAYLTYFYVESNEIDAGGNKIPPSSNPGVPGLVPAGESCLRSQSKSQLSGSQSQSGTT